MASIAEGKLSLKDFLESTAANKLQFTGQTTMKGNPIFTNQAESYPIALNLLRYYIREGIVTMDEEDNVSCEKGWRHYNGAWQPKARGNQEL